MLKKTITYTDYDGMERTEDFYFNLSKAELAEMEASVDGGMEKFIKKIIAEKSTTKIFAMFKDLVLRSYGEKTLDGKRFVKSKELSEAFSQTEAYSELVMSLIEDSEAAAAFVQGILPAEATANKSAIPAPTK